MSDDNDLSYDPEHSGSQHDDSEDGCDQSSADSSPRAQYHAPSRTNMPRGGIPWFHASSAFSRSTFNRDVARYPLHPDGVPRHRVTDSHTLNLSNMQGGSC